MSGWDKLKILTGAVAAILVPLAIAFVGQLYSKAIKDRELEGTFVELAVDILRDQPTPKTESLRQWATDVINEYSGVAMSDEARTKLIEKIPLPPGVSPSIWDRDDPLSNLRTFGWTVKSTDKYYSPLGYSKVISHSEVLSGKEIVLSMSSTINRLKTEYADWRAELSKVNRRCECPIIALDDSYANLYADPSAEFGGAIYSENKETAFHASMADWPEELNEILR